MPDIRKEGGAGIENGRYRGRQYIVSMIFFFSSRRRHTRLQGDWSSDVCSSDLGEKEPERIDVIAITHGHSDHVGETVELAKRFSPEIVAQVELKGWLGNQGAPVGDVPGPNKGGTVEAAGLRFTLTNAFHSSSSDDLTYLGAACGIRVGAENGPQR